MSFDGGFDEGGRMSNKFDEDVFYYDNEETPPVALGVELSYNFYVVLSRRYTFEVNIK